MESYNISFTENGIFVDGIKDAVFLKKLPLSIGKTISDYSLHREDLSFAKYNLDSINNVGIVEDVRLQQTLWRSAIVHYVKCFSSAKARGQLSFEKVYREAPPEARIAFDYIKELRNKTFIHDQNSYSQSIPCAALNGGGKQYHVEKILFLHIRAESLNQENYNNFYMLTTQALEFVNNELEKMFVRVTETLEALKLDEIMKYEDVKYTSPTLDEISKTRQY